MDRERLRGIVERIILTTLAQRGQYLVPVASSARHVHLSRTDIDRLFSPGYRLTKMRDLSQSGQYACEEKIILETPKGRLSLRVLGPERKETQVEISTGDAISLGLPPVIRMSGDTKGSPGGRLINGDRHIDIERGIIVAARHLHMAEDEALAYGLKNGDVVSVAVEGARGTVFANVVVRSGPGHVLEVHLDKDEANAAGLTDGSLCALIFGKQRSISAAGQKEKTAAQKKETGTGGRDLKDARPFWGEADILAAYRAGIRDIETGPRSVITPLARDAASRYGITIRRKTSEEVRKQ
jgi:putative phosphotransacetylase